MLDTSVIAALLNDGDPHHENVRAELESLRAEGRQFMGSTVTLAELLSNRRSKRRQLASKLVDRLGERFLVAVDRQVAELAGDLRVKKPSLSTPDALIAATAESVDADLLLTTDRKLAKVDRAKYIGRARR